MLTVDVVGLYPSTPHDVGLKNRALKRTLDNQANKKISTEDLIKVAELVFKSNYFELND